ncbi:MAG: hypothetical protein A2381_11350 [Bdellovibrionales bacterium RIFOXYB1_FULL_37_110]|nr:MAG: hypothetical protein A2417_11655 [Bdellovibrionales bacterium RIFOXYC1_FULL_37_79]OFZ57288.1 MAG: hypothetical protein A2381_11350 [Bdellovibrionales bacterium RIFOXYB1_FULL_37_110]OFZ62184.1 MAG: hypothetical protein A2577_13900 [Bdellovibrionales bacterium RIFOXYD1_FULL_36_51]
MKFFFIIVFFFIVSAGAETKYPLKCGDYEIFSKAIQKRSNDRLIIEIILNPQSYSKTKLILENQISVFQNQIFKKHVWVKLNVELQKSKGPYVFMGNINTIQYYPQAIVSKIDSFVHVIKEKECGR